MIKNVKLLTCDACNKSIELSDDKYPDGWWANEAGMGDLCPSCSVAWKSFKQDFIKRMRMNNLEDLK